MRRKAEARYEQPASESPDKESESTEASQVIREIVDGLPASQKEALLLQYVEELSVKQIARVMSKSRFAVAGLLQRARQTISRKGQGYFGEQQ